MYEPNAVSDTTIAGFVRLSTDNESNKNLNI